MYQLIFFKHFLHLYTTSGGRSNSKGVMLDSSPVWDIFLVSKGELL